MKPKERLRDLRNIGPAMEADLKLLGINQIDQLVDQDAFDLYERLCAKTAERHDPCVIDVFMAAIHQAEGGEPLDWWRFTPERKRLLAEAP